MCCVMVHCNVLSCTASTEVAAALPLLLLLLHLVYSEKPHTEVLVEGICAYRRNVGPDLKHYAHIWPGTSGLTQETLASPL